MSDDDFDYRTYDGAMPYRPDYRSIPEQFEHDDPYAGGVQQPPWATPDVRPPSYTSVPKHKKGIFRRAGSGLVSILLGLALAVAGIMVIAVGSGSKAGAIAIGILVLIVVLIRRRRRARRRNR